MRMPPAHHGPDGRFRNPWPGNINPGLGHMFRFLRERSRAAPTPPRGSFPVAEPAVVYPRADADTLSATWVGHSTVLLQLGNLNVITDPVFSPRAFPVQWAGPRRVMDPGLSLDALPPLDLILLSHNHYDHLDRPAVKRLVREHPDAAWVGPLGLAAYVRPWGVRNLIELDWWQETSIKGVRVTGTPARHFSARGLRDRNRSLWCGYALESAGFRLYFAGDSAYHPEFGEIGKRCGPFDLVMIPIGAYDPRWFMHVVHMNAEEAVQVYQDIVAVHPDAALPLMLGIHWGTFRLTTEPMDEPPRRAAAQWLEAGLDPARLWIAKFGETREVKGVLVPAGSTAAG
jgi:N-acyl-phosphatidylethanolamine-hydrolysing phospholipase D